MITTLNDFISEYSKIKAQCLICTHRSGTTGICKTLECLLGIQENNADEYDFGDYELKSCRLNLQNMLTLFTRTHQPPGSNKKLLLKYCYASIAYNKDKKYCILLLQQNDLFKQLPQEIN